MSWRRAPLLFGLALLASWLVNVPALSSIRLDPDSLNAMSAFFTARTPLGGELRWLAASRGLFSGNEQATNFLYWLAYGPLGARGPAGFRWLEVAFQAADGFLVMIAAELWVGGVWGVFAGLAFLLAPIHGMNWSCMGLPHYAAAFLCLLGLLWHARHRESVKGAAHVVGVLAFCCLAAFAKESGWMLPVLLAAFEAAQRRSRWRWVPGAACALAVCFVARRGWGEAWRWPAPVPVTAAWVAVLAAGGALLRLKTQAPWRRCAAFGLWWCAGGLLPVSGLLPVKLPQYIHGLSPRYLILPAAGAAWALAAVGQEWRRRGGRRGPVLAAAGLLGFMSWSSLPARGARAQETTFVRRELAGCLQPSLTWNCLAAARSLPLLAGRSPEAFAAARGGLRASLGPENADAFLAFFTRDPFDAGSARWRCAAQAGMDGSPLVGCIAAWQAHAEAGLALRAGRASDAASAQARATAAWPEFAEAWAQRASLDRALGRRDLARAEAYRAALCPMADFVLPDLPWAGKRFARLKRHSRAWIDGRSPLRLDGLGLQDLESIAEVDPDDEDLLREAALRLQEAGQPHRASRILLKLALRQPRNAVAWSDLGVAEALAGRDDRARADLRRALALDPSLREAARSLAALEGR